MYQLAIICLYYVSMLLCYVWLHVSMIIWDFEHFHKNGLELDTEVCGCDNQQNTGYGNMLNSIYIAMNWFELKDIASHDSRSNHVMSTTILQAGKRV